MLPNPYTYDETIAKLKFILEATKRTGSKVLLEMAIDKAEQERPYAVDLKNSLLHGGTCDLREVLSPFGDYMARTSNQIPIYPHHDAVNGIDTAMGAIKRGSIQETIDFYNLMHN